MTYQTDIDLVPRVTSGPPRKGTSTEERQRVYLTPLVNAVLEVCGDLDFKPSLRGVCYMLEGPGLSKGDFPTAETRLRMARRLQMLPIDFFSDDETRKPTGCGVSTDGPPLDHFSVYLRHAANVYRGVSTLEFYPSNVLVIVEKLDLVGLFQPITEQYSVPLYCGRGFSDIPIRIDVLKRAAKAWTRYRKPTTVLMFGDHDIGGLSITGGFANILSKWRHTAGVPESTLDHITVVRGGLNFDDIEAMGLSWIEGLETSGAKDYADEDHPNHNNRNVQDYINTYGARKVEANALMADVDGARELFRRELQSLIANPAVASYQRKLATGRKSMQKKAQELIRLAGGLA